PRPSPPLSSPLSLHDALPISCPGGSTVTSLAALRRSSWRSLRDARAPPVGYRTSPRATRLAQLQPVHLDEAHHSVAGRRRLGRPDRKSTRLNSSHRTISYAVF